MKGKGQEHKCVKRHEKENLTETNLLTLVPPIKFLSVCTSCSGAYLLLVDLVQPISQRTILMTLVPACPSLSQLVPVPGSFSRIELRALGPQRSDQNHHFCDIPENSLDPNADRDHADSRCLYGHPLILFTSTSETECYDSAAKRLCFRLYAHRTKHGTRTSRFVQLCSCGSKRIMF